MKAFVISPDQVSDRFVAFADSVTAHGGGLQVTHYPAADVSNLTKDSPEVRPYRILKGMLKGQVGCTMSHIALLQQCAAGNENYLIFENDALLDEDFTARPAFPDNVDYVTWHVANINNYYSGPEFLDEDGFIHIIPNKVITFPTCAIEWTPAGAQKFLDLLFKWIPTEQVKEGDIVLDTSDGQLHQSKIFYAWHDIQQMLYIATHEGIFIDGVHHRMKGAVHAASAVNNGSYPSTISNGDYFIPPNEPTPVVIDFETAKRRKRNLIKRLGIQSTAAGYTDSVLPITLATGDTDIEKFGSLKQGLEIAATPDTDPVNVRNLEGELVTYTCAEVKALISRYSAAMIAGWQNITNLEMAVEAATTIEELNQIVIP